MAGYEQQHDYDAASGADEQEREARTGKVKTTTADLFARVRKTLTDETICPENRAWRALSELERRMGAMERAMSMASDVLRRIGKSSAADPLTGQQCRDLLKTRETLDTALTDAPPVVTLEEVTQAMRDAARDMRGDDTASDFRDYVRERLTALRSTGGGR